MTIQFYLILRHDQFTSMNIVLKYFNGINHIAPISVLACKYHIQPYLTFPDSKGKLVKYRSKRKAETDIWLILLNISAPQFAY